MKKRFTMVAACLLMGMSTVLAQNTKVTGHVVDENGEPVIGASVVVKGTTIGTVLQTSTVISYWKCRKSTSIWKSHT